MAVVFYNKNDTSHTAPLCVQGFPRAGGHAIGFP